MNLVIGLLTFVLVVNCLFLMLLVLIQLPKKEAGAGLAFGGGATDALFGAGSGNALTRLTRYTATLFLSLALVLAVLNARRHGSSSEGIQEELRRQGSAAPAAVATPPPAATQPQPMQPAPLTGSEAPVLTPMTELPEGTLQTAPPPAATPQPEPQP